MDFFRKEIRQFRAFPEALQELVYHGLAVAGGFGDLPTAHPIGETEHEHSLVFHVRTSSKWIPLHGKRYFHYCGSWNVFPYKVLAKLF